MNAVIVEIAPREALALQRAGAWLVDVREPDEVAQGSPVGARRVPLAGVVAGLGSLDGARDRTILTICGSGKRSLRAAEALRDAGFVDVRSIAGGMASWRADALPEEATSLLPAQERDRYSRHLLLPGVGERAHGVDRHVGAAEHQLQAAAQAGVVFHDQQAAVGVLGPLADALDGRDQLLAQGRLHHVADGTHLEGRQAALLCRHDVHRDVPRGGVALEPLQHRQARDVGQAHVEQHAHGPQLLRQHQGLGAVLGHHAFEIHLLDHRAQGLRERTVVLDGQQHLAPAGGQSERQGGRYGRFSGTALAADEVQPGVGEPSRPTDMRSGRHVCSLNNGCWPRLSSAI